jgi:hypothetical protein
MPKNPVDYSKTLIYKICCRDPTITDIYVGHTTNKTERKRLHRNKCNNQNFKDCNIYVYQFIRNNGGWDNWDMLVIEEYPCENMYEACLRERHWLETLHATLNTNIPSRTYQQWTDDNKEHLKDYKAKWYEDNRKERNEKIECECGGKYTKQHKLRHFKSQKHLKYLNEINV